MDVRDVRMVQGGEELGFALEPGNATRSVVNVSGRTLIAMSRFKRMSRAR